MDAGPSPFTGPLQVRNFRLLWISGLALYLALWMQVVGASWLMLSLAPSPLMVALIQTAQSLPVFLLVLPAGVLADVVDRRVLILLANALLCVAAGIATIATATAHMTPLLLLLVTGAVGAGFALQAPAVQTSQAESVPREQMFAALTLGTISFNTARAVGPALAGVLVSIAGTVAVFGACTLCFLISFANMLRWRHRLLPAELPPERVLLGVRSALQYARHSPVIRQQLLRTLLFVTAASGLWALLPIVARDRLHMQANGYGLLLGCMGAGAIAGSMAAVRFRRRGSINAAGIVATVAYAAGVAATALTQSVPIVCLALGLAGAGWAVVGNVNLTSVQTSIPPWVRARAMALYLLVFQGAMAVGGVLWGGIAQHASLEVALLATVAALGGTIVIMRAIPARIGDAAEATPSALSDLPQFRMRPAEHDGPIAVQINYSISPQDRPAFLEVMEVLGRARKRDGALFWRIYRDLGQPQRYAERFVVRSWTDYLRQRARATEADRRIEQQAWSMHIGPEPPEMQHMLAEHLRADTR